MSYVDLNLRLPELLLMRVDKMTMGVEPGGTGAVSRSSVRRPRVEHSERAEDEERDAEVRPQESRRGHRARRT